MVTSIMTYRGRLVAKLIYPAGGTITRDRRSSTKYYFEFDVWLCKGQKTFPYWRTLQRDLLHVGHPTA